MSKWTRPFSVNVSSLTNKQTKKLKTKEFEKKNPRRSDKFAKY